MLTLNQTVEIIKNFCSNHLVVNSFYFGDEWEKGQVITTNADKSIVYPNLQATLTGSSKSKDMISRTFLIVVSDLVNKGESNETHVISDVEQICYDMFYYLEQIETDGNIGLVVSKDGNLTDFTERTDDEVSGWFFEITLTSHIGNNSCVLPILGGNYFDDNYIYVGGSYVPSSGGGVATVKNSNNTYSTTVNGGDTLTLPDETLNIYVNAILNQTLTYIPLSANVINITA